MGDYFRHWIEMGKRIPKPPKIFHVNWFKTDAQGQYLWPGFGDNLRVLEWILDRCEDKAPAKDTAIGRIPETDGIDLSGLGFPAGRMEQLLSVDVQAWRKEQEDQARFFETFGDRLPQELRLENEALKKRLS
jgi:phosphoenolpyruvate carboxykinase (GTP)